MPPKPSYLNLSPAREALLLEVEAKMTTVLTYFTRGSPDLTDHGPNHSKRLIEYLNQMFFGPVQFTDSERFVLYLSAWLHDLGCVQTRKYHNIESERMIRESESLRYILKKMSKKENTALRKVVIYHSGKFDVSEIKRYANLDIPKISAIFRFVDACDISRNRAPKEVLEFLKEDIPLVNRVYWLAHLNILDVAFVPKKHSIRVVIVLAKPIGTIRQVDITSGKVTRSSQQDYVDILTTYKCMGLIDDVKNEAKRVNGLVKGLNISLKIEEHLK